MNQPFSKRDEWRKKQLYSWTLFRAHFFLFHYKHKIKFSISNICTAFVVVYSMEEKKYICCVYQRIFWRNILKTGWCHICLNSLFHMVSLPRLYGSNQTWSNRCQPHFNQLYTRFWQKSISRSNSLPEISVTDQTPRYKSEINHLFGKHNKAVIKDIILKCLRCSSSSDNQADIPLSASQNVNLSH